MNKIKNILVTGGAGYIGSHIVQLLCDNDYNVYVFDDFSLGWRENIDQRVTDTIVGDVKNKADLDKAFSNNIDAVFHFAAWKAAGESMTDPGKYAENNITGTLTLLNKMVEYDVKYFVFSSSAAVYGNPKYLPIDENHPKDPTNYYGYTKLAMEENLKWYGKLKGIKYAALRYFNAAGYDINGKIRGKERNALNLSPVVMETLSGMRDKMFVFGNDYDTPDGTCIRDYIHVSDLATAHLMAMKYIQEQSKNLTVNLGTGKGATVLEVINAAEIITGMKVNYEIVGRRTGDPGILFAKADLAYELLGWETQYSDIETIMETMKKVYLE